MQTKICCSSFLIFLLSWASLPSYAQNRVHQLARDIYYWSGDLSKHEQTNVGFVVFRDYVLVIDANFPWAAEKIITDIKKSLPNRSVLSSTLTIMQITPWETVCS